MEMEEPTWNVGIVFLKDLLLLEHLKVALGQFHLYTNQMNFWFLTLSSMVSNLVRTIPSMVCGFSCDE